MTTKIRFTQAGVSLLEALLAILIFSVGILALVALQSISVKATTESKFRADAGLLASQLVARMWTDSAVWNTVSRPDLRSYAHNTGGADCAFSGGASANPNVVAWVNSIVGSAGNSGALPGSTATSIQVIPVFNPNLPDHARVAINICWRPPGADAMRQFSTVTQLL